MEYKLKSKIKKKIVCIVLLLAICLVLLVKGGVTVESLFNGIDISKVLVKTDVTGQVQVLNQSEDIDITTRETKDVQDILQAEDLELEETKDTYIVTGNIDSSLIHPDANGVLGIKYFFDKQTKQLMRSEIELSNQLNDKIFETVAKEISDTNNLTEAQTNSIVTVDSDTKVEIVPTDVDFQGSIEDELKKKLSILNSIKIDNQLKEITIGEKKYILGTTEYIVTKTDNKEEPSETSISIEDIIEDDVLYHIIGQNNSKIVFGISGEKDKVKYLSEEEIISKLGEPTVMGKSKYWNVSVDNEEINIVITDKTIEVLYKK